MGAGTGVQPIVTYNAGTDKLKVQQLIDLVPNPDVSPAQGGGTGAGRRGHILDEMSPAAAAQLRVELAALMAAVT